MGRPIQQYGRRSDRQSFDSLSLFRRSLFHELDEASLQLAIEFLKVFEQGFREAFANILVDALVGFEERYQGFSEIPVDPVEELQV